MFDREPGAAHIDPLHRVEFLDTDCRQWRDGSFGAGIGEEYVDASEKGSCFCHKPLNISLFRRITDMGGNAVAASERVNHGIEPPLVASGEHQTGPFRQQPRRTCRAAPATGARNDGHLPGQSSQALLNLDPQT